MLTHITSPRLQDLLDSHVTAGPPRGGNDSAAAPPDSSAAAQHRLAWLLFLVVKHRLLPPHPDLVSLFHLLLAVVAALRDHAPWAPEFSGTEQEGDKRECTLAALAAAHKASAEEVRRVVAGQTVSLATRRRAVLDTQAAALCSNLLCA